jgi:hypothetical protein
LCGTSGLCGMWGTPGTCGVPGVCGTCGKPRIPRRTCFSGCPSSGYRPTPHQLGVPAGGVGISYSSRKMSQTHLTASSDRLFNLTIRSDTLVCQCDSASSTSYYISSAIFYKDCLANHRTSRIPTNYARISTIAIPRRKNATPVTR